MSGLFSIVERLFWLIVWVFLALILGNFLFNWLRNTNTDGIASIADWIERRASVG